MKNLIFLNFLIPIVTKLLIPDGRYGVVTIITDLVALPVVLIILNVVFVLNKLGGSAFKCFSFMLIGLLLGDAVGYIIWGMSSKNLFTPDAETVWVYQRLILYHTSFAVIVFVVFRFGQFSLLSLRRVVKKLKFS